MIGPKARAWSTSRSPLNLLLALQLEFALAPHGGDLELLLPRRRLGRLTTRFLSQAGLLRLPLPPPADLGGLGLPYRKWLK